MAPRTTIAVILSVGGAPLDAAALADLPAARLVRAQFAQGDAAVCVAATLEHAGPRAALRRALAAWATPRGWSVTIAPLTGPD
ncbi:MAG: hypothetical protein OER21_06495 [Gemmatimonadota bacterium]|nr:hypothetical protein [Gemmatimonadota bacterium]